MQTMKSSISGYSPIWINTRMQLLEYSKVFNNKNLILIDTEKNKIKKIEF